LLFFEKLVRFFKVIFILSLNSKSEAAKKYAEKCFDIFV
jgi:hypothetical protein